MNLVEAGRLQLVDNPCCLLLVAQAVLEMGREHGATDSGNVVMVIFIAWMDSSSW
jgi:hypothetical protein